MAATDQLQFFVGAKTQKNSFVNFFLLLTAHSQQHVYVQVIFNP